MTATVGARGEGSDAAVVRFDDVTKLYGRVRALDGLSLDVRPGEVFGLLGPNGAGKTTALRVLLGSLRATAGRVLVLGLDAWADPVAVHRRLGYVTGELGIWPNLTGGQILELLGRLHGGVDTAYREQLIERFDFDPTKKGRSYSTGNRQKVAVIAALATRAELLVLDEPTSGLDPLMKVTFEDCVREARAGGGTVLLSSHVLAEVEAVCDRVGILRQGRLVDSGTLDELRHLSASTVEATFSGSPPSLAGIPGVDDVEVADGVLRLQVSGSTAPLITALGSAEITSLQVRQPSLEELFLTYYGDGERASDAPSDGR
ncbi:MAG: ABC transporter ATP-binding protein [Gaiellaceae bacterium]